MESDKCSISSNLCFFLLMPLAHAISAEHVLLPVYNKYYNLHSIVFSLIIMFPYPTINFSPSFSLLFFQIISFLYANKHDGLFPLMSPNLHN